MFLDGITYATISRNISINEGSFWLPQYTATFGSSFYAHLPLSFFIQGAFFSFMGDHFFVERLYGLIMLVISAYLIKKFWCLIIDGHNYKELFILPVVIWLTMPIVMWSFSNNILENTLTVFDLLAVYLIIFSIQKQSLIFSIIGGISIYLALLSKGPVALFPLIVPVLYKICNPHSKVLSSLFLTSLTFFALFTITIYSSSDAKTFIENYYNIQLAPALFSPYRPWFHLNFDILIRLFLELLVPISILIILELIRVRYRIKRNPTLIKFAILFFLIGLSASIPLIISMKQSRFYLLPSTPYFALCVSLIIAPILNIQLERIPKKINRVLKILSIPGIALVILLTITHYGKIKRDESYIHDVEKIGEIVGAQQVISGHGAVCQDWLLLAYLHRMESISYSCEGEHTYKIVRSDEIKDFAESEYLFHTLTNFTLLEKRIQSINH